MHNVRKITEDLYWIGYIYNKLNEIDKSIYYYEKSLDLNADFLNIFIELGLLYYKMQKIEKKRNINFSFALLWLVL